MRRTCPGCGAVWTLTLNRGAVHRSWHDDPRCAGCRGSRPDVDVAADLAEAAAAAVVAAGHARDALEAELAAALAEQEQARPIRLGIPWSDEERAVHRRTAIDAHLDGHLVPDIPQGDWVSDALCAQVDGELFFPEKGGSNREAKAVCGRCPVTQECLDWAMATDQPAGIFGGLSVNERRRLRREQAS